MLGRPTTDWHRPTSSQSYRPSIPLPSNGNRTGKLRVRVYPRVGAGRVRVRVSKSATGTGRVAEMVDPHTIIGESVHFFVLTNLFLR